MILQEGETINDVYEIDRFLGEGAFAEVYRVKHKFLGRQAMKVFKSPNLEYKDIEQNLAEALLLSKIGHPNIIRVFDAGIINTDVGQRGYITMEYVPGGTLGSFWNSYKNGFIPISSTVDIIRQVCMGLSVAHSKKPPIIHRDIKPQNILVGYDIEGFRIKVSDFGLAKAANPLTLLASAKGTPAFKPPECMNNMDSSAGDVWAIGVTLYLLLTDHLPFPIENIMDLSTNKWLKHKLISPMEFNPRVDNYLESIVLRSLTIDSTERYQTAMVMLEDLMQWTPPKSKYPKKSENSLHSNKDSLSLSTESREFDVKKQVKEALNMSQNASKLTEAADLLEEAITRDSDLCKKYEYRLKLWRRGIAM
ncbi:serine/threonine-protein kinase [Chloroflexota bacterium]